MDREELERLKPIWRNIFLTRFFEQEEFQDFEDYLNDLRNYILQSGIHFFGQDRLELEVINDLLLDIKVFYRKKKIDKFLKENS